MSPAFNANALIKLAERTEYEAWLLEDVYALVENELFPSFSDGVIYPVCRSKAEFFSQGRLKINIGDWRPGFLNAGAPLVFVSIFKLLDMLLEWVLEENGFSSTSSFEEKSKRLKGPTIFPPLIESRVWLKERLVALYSALKPLRGTIIHDRHFTATDGAIRVASSKKGVIGAPVEVSATYLRMLACFIVSVVKYIDGTWQLDEFREKTLRYSLDQLAALHGLPSLGQSTPFHTCVRVYSTDSNPVVVDVVTIRMDLATRYLNNDCSFDLRVLMVADGEVLDAYLFPWPICADANVDWPHSINVEQYRIAIPMDIKREHLCCEQG